MLPFIVSGLVFAPTALAQQTAGPANPALPTEKVIVTAPKQVREAVIRDFIKSYAAPSPMIDKIARWREPICPAAVGLPPEYTKLVTERVRQVATMVDAPVDSREACRANIDIVFTPKPQALLDDIRKRRPMFLGYHDVSQAGRIATVSHPVQAWYTTQTADQNGLAEIDDETRNRGVDIMVPSFGHFYTLHLPNAREERGNLTHLSDGLHSEFFHVLVVIDMNGIVGREIGALADYTAMLALSQTQVFDACKELPSITNLMSPGCEASRMSNTLTDNDIAYLRALYRMNPELTLDAQRGEIAGGMASTLADH